MFQHLNSASHFAKTGRNQQVATIPWLSSDFQDLGTTSPIKWQLAMPWYDDFGNEFIVKIVRGGAVALGNTLTWNLPGTDTAAASSTTRIVNLTTGGLTAGAETFGLGYAANFLYDRNLAVSGTPTTDGLKVIKGNAAGTITVSLLDTKYANNQADQDAYATAPATNDVLAIIRPYEVAIAPSASAATLFCAGVATGAILQNHWGFTQVGGLALTVAVGSVTALVAGAPAVPSGAANGTVIGAAAASANAVGMSAVAYNAASGLCPVWLVSPFYS